ncbi:hemophore [Mycobacterium sp.]|uniref:hemophore n=1 Tax=Mycobacterium sp. TaxID=1785 RepID=UPI002D06EDFD|nr:hemophore [Mycobacterium sp.]HME49096.1 hemophore [Mycobacterium sp.]
MKTTAPRTVRRSRHGASAACVIGGVAAAVIAVPSATAAPNPCAASEIARTIGSVSTNTGNYLDSHPDANTALTNAAQQPAPQAPASLKTYFDANPQVGKDLQTIQQPLAGLSGQCKLPITVPQALQFLQAAAQNGGLPGGGAQPAGLPSGSAAQPAQVPVATGPLPGPATTTTAVTTPAAH